MINATCTLVGRCAQPGELKYFGENPKLGLRLAVDRRAKVADKWENVTTWWTVEIWGKDAVFLHPRLAKGAAVTVIGEPYSEDWQTREGEKRTALRVRAHSILLHQRPAAAEGSDDGPATDPAAPRSKAPAGEGDEPPF